MSGNITVLRGLEPPATEQEIYAAAQEYVRKVGGLSGLSSTTKPAFDKAVAAVAEATKELLGELPDRGLPPVTNSPLR
ncbi:DUF2277 domain-containing protein [Nocardia blacklockiae]|uniref:DUF2277 domain-containing protein n=1 Tax=Nocardia blacklockiae TaxID=480036 RepID=UPI0018938B4F|nr:DUF2277 domain-containing protein [Nocardia blacklockiae]MBF6173203.1 DUF2277 domain-containing protein [Nocardia blacklockiae]